MLQTRLGSLIEAVLNILIGYGIALLSQLILFPLFGVNVNLIVNIQLGAWFTFISLVRSYVIRRWFNSRLHKAAEVMASTL